MCAKQGSSSSTLTRQSVSQHLCLTCEQYVSTDGSRHDGAEVNFDVTEGAAAPPHGGSSAGFEPQFWSLEKCK